MCRDRLHSTKLAYLTRLARERGGKMLEAIGEQGPSKKRPHLGTLGGRSPAYRYMLHSRYSRTGLHAVCFEAGELTLSRVWLHTSV